MGQIGSKLISNWSELVQIGPTKIKIGRKEKKIKQVMVLISGLVLDFCYVPKNAKNWQRVPKSGETKIPNVPEMAKIQNKKQ